MDKNSETGKYKHSIHNPTFIRPPESGPKSENFNKLDIF